MKLIIAIVQDEDASRLVNQLMKAGIGVTKLATTGGFLRAGNTTLLIGVDDAKLRLSERNCRERWILSRKSASRGSRWRHPRHRWAARAMSTRLSRWK